MSSLQRSPSNPIPTPPLAIIDIGSNSVLLLVVQRDVDGKVQVLADCARVTGLGKGLAKSSGNAKFNPEAEQSTLHTIRDFGDLARQHGAEQVVAVATEAVRRASNAGPFLDEIRKMGVQVDLISGRQEALYAATAVSQSLPRFAEGHCTVLDLGGASMEAVHMKNGRVDWWESIDLGVVTLTQTFGLGSSPGIQAVTKATDHTNAKLSTSKFTRYTQQDALMAAVGGTATTLAAMMLQLDSYCADSVHGQILPLSFLRQTVDALRYRDASARAQLPGLPKDRAEVMLAGALIFQTTLQAVNANNLTVSDRGLRWGVAFELLSTSTTKAGAL